MKRLMTVAVCFGVYSLSPWAWANGSEPPDEEPAEQSANEPMDETPMGETMDESKAQQPMAQPRAMPMPKAPPPAPPPPPPTEKTALASGVGVSVSVGGGFSTFLLSDVTDFTDPGGGWDARVAIGTREYFAIEGAYLGNVYNIDALGLDNDALLVGNGVEAAARFNVLKGAIQPYALAGVGWKHYSIANADRNTSSLADNDNVAEFPVGVGLAYRDQGIVLDGRAVVRPTAGSDLIDAAVANADDVRLHNLAVNLTLGVEF